MRTPGALLVARYVGRVQHPSPDDDVFRHVAAVYANNHATMWQGRACRASEDAFPGGITNGAEWYIIKGETLCSLRAPCE